MARFALLLTLALLGAPSAVSKSVKIGVEASWDNTPLVLEARSAMHNQQQARSQFAEQLMFSQRVLLRCFSKRVLGVRRAPAHA